MKYLNVSIAVAGEGKTIPSIILCLLQAGHRVKSIGGTKKGKALHELAGFSSVSLDNYQDCQGLPEKENLLDCSLIIIFTPENPDIKKTWISRIARIAPEHALILVNSESIPLEELQSGLPDPSRLLGLNWVYPAHLTLFAELLSTPENREEEMEALMVLMAKNWGKDPYHLKSGKSIRSKLLAALAREAFFLVDQGYVEVADIDRACRNDPGYYLPFAGNCRYMDLMGTFIYGVVMKDLNPELSNAMEIPAYFNKLMDTDTNKSGLGQGFYAHSPATLEKREHSFLEFSREMSLLMARYPFPKEDYGEEEEMVPEKDKIGGNINSRKK